MLKPNLTQDAILFFVAQYAAKHDFSPTFQEIADALSITSPSVSKHIDFLEQAGYVVRLPGKATRRLQLTDQALIYARSSIDRYQELVEMLERVG